LYINLVIAFWVYYWNMAQKDTVNSTDRLSVFLRILLGGLIGLFISGTAMVAIGQPTSTHKLSSGGNALWHTLLAIHLILLTALTISAVSLVLLSITKLKSLRTRFVLGILAVVFGIVSGILVLHKIHPGIFLFCMALAFLLIGTIYGPIAGHGGRKR
jgi:tetrahydromethanopterin S-methyltransferase subunit E